MRRGNWTRFSTKQKLNPVEKKAENSLNRETQPVKKLKMSNTKIKKSIFLQRTRILSVLWMIRHIFGNDIWVTVEIPLTPLCTLPPIPTPISDLFSLSSSLVQQSPEQVSYDGKYQTKLGTKQPRRRAGLLCGRTQHVSLVPLLSSRTFKSFFSSPGVLALQLFKMSREHIQVTWFPSASEIINAASLFSLLNKHLWHSVYPNSEFISSASWLAFYFFLLLIDPLPSLRTLGQRALPSFHTFYKNLKLSSWLLTCFQASCLLLGVRALTHSALVSAQSLLMSPRAPGLLHSSYPGSSHFKCH